MKIVTSHNEVIVWGFTGLVCASRAFYVLLFNLTELDDILCIKPTQLAMGSYDGSIKFGGVTPEAMKLGILPAWWGSVGGARLFLYWRVSGVAVSSCVFRQKGESVPTPIWEGLTHVSPWSCLCRKICGIMFFSMLWHFKWISVLLPGGNYLCGAWNWGSIFVIDLKNRWSQPYIPGLNFFSDFSTNKDCRLPFPFSLLHAVYTLLLMPPNTAPVLSSRTTSCTTMTTSLGLRPWMISTWCGIRI